MIKSCELQTASGKGACSYGAGHRDEEKGDVFGGCGTKRWWRGGIVGGERGGRSCRLTTSVRWPCPGSPGLRCVCVGMCVWRDAANLLLPNRGLCLHRGVLGLPDLIVGLCTAD